MRRRASANLCLANRYPFAEAVCLIAEELRMNKNGMKLMVWSTAFACVALLPLALVGQSAAKPAAKAPAGDSASKWDIFAGYSYLSPDGLIKGQVAHTPSSTYGQINLGAAFSLTRYFNSHLGVQIEASEHIQAEDWPAGDYNAFNNSNDDFAGGSAGLIYRLHTGSLTPFIHALVGTEEVGSLYRYDTWGKVATTGGGLDWNTPLLNHHLAWRVFQADYQYIHADDTQINAFRLSTGAVYHIGSIAAAAPVTLACTTATPSVFAGETVSVSATAGSLDPRAEVLYSWSGDGVTNNGASATVNTSSMAPGTYSVKATVKEGKPGREGLKAGEMAECAASFTVKPYEPPTIACSISPSTIKPGDPATIKATALSPQNRPLTYSYSASAGTVSGSGDTVIYDPAGAPTGAVAITCNVSDDKGKTASAEASLTIVAPYIPPPPRTQALCSVSFNKDKKRPTRVNNEAKACLDDVALNLQKQPDAKAVVVGASDAEEKALAARSGASEDAAVARAVNTKSYLVTEKGIDASRISLATSSENSQKVEDYLVPAGANFASDVQGINPVNEDTVRPVTRRPLTAKKHVKMAVKKTADQ
jgi:hypothetical protein